MFVSGLEMVPAGKSSGKHENGGFWGMEIGDQSVNGLELETRVDEYIVLAESFTGFSPKFERASNGSTNGNNAMARGFGSLDCFNGVVWNMKPFGVHMMFFDFITADWQESAETDVEGKIFNLDAFGLKFFNKFFSHVKAGGRRSG